MSIQYRIIDEIYSTLATMQFNVDIDYLVAREELAVEWPVVDKDGNVVGREFVLTHKQVVDIWKRMGANI